MGAVRPGADHNPADSNVDPQAVDNEAPIAEVRLECFFMSKYEMTQEQWRRLVGTNPSRDGPGESFGGKALDPRRPVGQVSWGERGTWRGRLGLILSSE